MALYIPQGDFITTNLVGAVTSTSTSATIGSGLSLDVNGGILQVDYDSTLPVGTDSGPETFIYTSYNTTTGALTGLTRGQYDTVAVSHSNGASVQCGTSSGYLLQGRVLNYAQITSPFTSNTISSDVDVTGLSFTITVPAGGLYVRLSAFARSFYTGATTQSTFRVAIKEGSTTLATTWMTPTQANMRLPVNVSYVSKVSVGSHTYKVSIIQDTNAGTMTLDADPTSAAYLLAEIM